MKPYHISLEKIKEKITRRSQLKELSWQNIDEASKIKEISNNYGEKLMRVDGDIPISLPIRKGQRFLFISYEQSRYTHGIHKYPAKFFPELPRWLIKKYSKVGDNILDPFSGSATTNIEALLSGRNSVAIDVDPFSRYLSKVKTTRINSDILDNVVEIILKELVKFSPDLVDNKDIPTFPYRDNWFKDFILLELAYIKKIILKSTTNSDIKDFLLITMSSVIRAVSNADNNCTRTVVRKKLNKEIYPSQALVKFAEHLILYSHRIKEFNNACYQSAFVEIPDNNDARFFTYPDNHFDIAITSPPYVNAVDYPRTHQLEIYWLDMFIGSLSPLKEKHVGTEVVKAKDYKIYHQIGVKEADILIKKIFELDQGRAFIAYKYLYDMKLNLKEVYRALKPGGKYIIVVGNNRIKGHLFESWKYLMTIAEQIGFKVETFFGSEIIKHFIKVPREERIDTDWIIVLNR